MPRPPRLFSALPPLLPLPLSHTLSLHTLGRGGSATQGRPPDEGEGKIKNVLDGFQFLKETRSYARQLEGRVRI